MTSNGKHPERVFICVWFPTMYHDDTKRQLHFLGIQHAIVHSFSELKDISNKRCSAGLAFSHLLIDGGLIKESVESICSDLLVRCPKVFITVVVPPIEERINPRAAVDRLSKVAETPRVAFVPAEAFNLESYLHRLDVNAHTSATRKVMLRHSKHPTFDAIAMEDNDLAKAIDEELSTISASIHLDDKLLEDGYVCSKGNPNDIIEHAEVNERSSTGAVAHEYISFINRWRSREKNRDDFAKEVVYHYMTKARKDTATTERKHYTEKDPDLYVLHKKLSHWLEVRNRRTYLLVGQRGSGKTTFLHFYRLFYAPSRNIFVVDFLPFNFKADAQQIFLKLETELFQLLKADGRSEAVNSYTTLYDYRASFHSDTPPCLFAECRRFNLQIPTVKLQEYIEEVLFNCTTGELLKIWRKANEQADGQQGAESLLTIARAWRDEVIRNPTTELVRILCQTFRDDWVMAPVEWFAESLLEDILHVANNPIPSSGDKSKMLLHAITETAKEQNVSVEGIIDLNATAKISFTKALVRRIGTSDNPVIVFVDNADRAVAPSTEVEIFKNSWQFVFDRSGKAKLLFAVRVETYDKHKTIFGHLDQTVSTESTSKYADRVANIAKLGLQPPKVAEILQARTYAVTRQLERQNRDEKTRKTFREYVCRARADADSNKIFDVLFGGDFRTNLELFESILRSPHIVGSNLHFVAKKSLDSNNVSRELEVHIQRHRLLTAIMLKNHCSFRQDRAGTVILNVYNANLLTPDGVPESENTLILHRTLRYICAHDSMHMGEMTDKLATGLTVSKDNARKALQLLEAFHLISFAENRLDAEGPRISITESGKYYLDSLINRLEYIQAVYWETWVDEDVAFTSSDFPITDIANLLPFVDGFVEFLIREESREVYRNRDNPEYEKLMSAIFRNADDRCLSSQVQCMAMDQVMRIYLAARNRQ